MSLNKANLIGNEYINRIVSDGVNNLMKSKGGIVLISGESGFGKTHILNYYFELFKNRTNLKVISTEAQSPIGNFNLGSLQPLLPFSKAIENYFKDNNISPEKRFAKNLGLTVLASIPLIDTVFYAVKEIGKDWRQFKQEKSTERNKNINSVTIDYFDTFISFAEKTPLVLLMDDMHWADPQSVELLQVIADNLSDIPILIVASYKKSITEVQSLPINNFVFRNQSKDGISFLEIETFTYQQISQISSQYFDNYKPNQEFEEWLYEKSLGVPGVVSEYLNYFSKFPPFAPDGSLVTNFKGNEFLPSNVQSVFAQHIDTLSDEEKNILSICSAEGREFSALIVSQLMNVDVLTCIKKLRNLQSKTGIIKSLGARTKYGAKTTIYKFTQQFYYNYFENSLEFEEYTALHAEIATLLKQKYDQTDSDVIKEELAPYLAAHSAESGDDETAKSMLLASAHFAEKFGSNEIIKSAYEKYSEIKTENTEENVINNIDFLQLIGPDKTIINENATANISNDKIEDNIISVYDFKIYRKAIENDLITAKYANAKAKAKQLIDDKIIEISENEKIQILSLLIKSYICLREFNEIEKYFKELNSIDSEKIDQQHKCLIHNITAQYYFYSDNMSKALSSLDKAASLVNSLPHELRLLTLANIGIITQNSSPYKSKEYIHSAKKLSENLNFKKLKEDLEPV